MEQISFEQRVLDVAMAEATNYQSVFVEWEYLICSEAFQKKNYYIIDAKPDNYQHLVGISSQISPQDFFDKCLSRTLTTADFNFHKYNLSEKAVKGSVRRKIKALPLMMIMLNDNLLVQETFIKNNVSCSFASSDNLITVGFAAEDKARPMTLLAKNELSMADAKPVSLILKRKSGDELFNHLVVGSTDVINLYDEKIRDVISPNIFAANLPQDHI